MEGGLTGCEGGLYGLHGWEVVESAIGGALPPGGGLSGYVERDT